MLRTGFKFRSEKLKIWLRLDGKRRGEFEYMDMEVVFEKQINSLDFSNLIFYIPVNFVDGICITDLGNGKFEIEGLFNPLTVAVEGFDCKRFLQSFLTVFLKMVVEVDLVVEKEVRQKNDIEVENEVEQEVGNEDEEGEKVVSINVDSSEDRREHKIDNDTVVDGRMEISDDVHGGESVAGEVKDGEYKGQENGQEIGSDTRAIEKDSCSDTATCQTLPEKEAGRQDKAGSVSGTPSEEVQETANSSEEEALSLNPDQDDCSQEQSFCREQSSQNPTDNCSRQEQSRGFPDSNQGGGDGENRNSGQSSCQNYLDCGNNKGGERQIKDEGASASSDETPADLQEQEAVVKGNVPDTASFIEKILEIPLGKEEKIPQRHFNLPYTSGANVWFYEILKEVPNSKKFKKIELIFKKYLTLSARGKKSPQIDKVKLIKNLVSFKNPYFSNKEDISNDRILLMVDISESMSNFISDSSLFYKLAKKYKNDFILIINTNAFPEIVVIDGKDYSIESDKIDWEEAHKYYDKLLKKYNIKLVVTFTDWDGVSIYEKLLKKSNCKMLSLDVYCCNYGKPEKVKNKKYVEKVIPDEVREFWEEERLISYVRVGDFDEAIEVMKKEL